MPRSSPRGTGRRGRPTWRVADVADLYDLSMLDSGRPVRVAVVNDYELVVLGVGALLSPFSDRVEVVELDSNLPVAQDVDVVLFDTFGQSRSTEVDLEQLVGDGPSRVVVYSWNVQRELVEVALRAGAAGYLSKGLDAERLVSALEAVADGKTVVPEDGDAEAAPPHGRWPGQEHGLTERESEILALITQGLSNQEIAQRCWLSINSVKTYIRTAYRKMGVERRSQAVLWGVQHGFEPDVVRRSQA